MLLRNMPNGRKPIYTYAFVLVCVAVFVLDQLSALWLYGLRFSQYNGLLTQLGMRWNPAIASGEYWRLMTAVFLHASLIHLAMNMFALLVWGPMAEYFFSGKKYLCILLASGFLSCAAGFAFSSAASVGASGAVFGMMGAFLSIRRQNRAFFDRFFGPSILVYVALSIGLGFLQGSVDNLGHIGGLIGGYLVGICTGFGPFPGNKVLRIGAGAGFAALCALCLVIGSARLS